MAGISNMLNGLLSSIGGSPATNATTKAATGGIGSLLGANTALQYLLSEIPPDYSQMDGPPAQLVMLFFDERFTFVPEASQTLVISQTGAGAPPLALLNIKAPRNACPTV